ncbi:MAG: hypothetical protein EU533_02685 [Promethearchaeota archaeon]|nr:MAG: hypothetical protein EU533_02685 [Candidatus Lokiarchaeota archaeon]
MAISDDGILFAGWKNSETHYGGGARVSFTCSLDNGRTWSSPYDMPMFGGLFTRQSDPWLYWKNGTLYYSYLEFEAAYLNDPSGDYLTQMTVAKSIDNGVSWTPVKATNNSYFADKETIVVDDNDIVYLAYDDADIENLYGTATVKVTRSVDGGNSYQDLANIGEDEYFIGPYINVNASNDIFVAWSWIPPGGGNIFFSKSIDKGFSFEEPKIINYDGNYSAIEAPGKTTLPLIKFDSFNRLYLVWADKFDQVYDTFDVYLRYSDDSGETWSDRIRVNPSVQGNQWNPDLAIDLDGTLHFVYYHEINGYYRPYYRTLQFNGTNRDIPIFSDQIVIADSFTSSKFIRPGEYFAIQLDNDNIPHVVWTDGRNNELDIYYAKGLTTLPLFTPELTTVILVITIVAILSISGIYYYIRVKRSSKVDKNKLKLYKKTYTYFCENCQSFTNKANFCENCGTTYSIRKAVSRDYKEHLVKK